MSSKRENLSPEGLLDSGIVPTGAFRPTRDPQIIFLTGATGFLGAYVLCDLLRLTRADIYCLIRAESAAAAKQRVLDNLAYYGLQPKDFESRVICLRGDLEQPNFNLSPEVLAWLGEHVDTIYHLAASVSFMSTYEQAKPINVTALQRLLRLACVHHTKAVHYSSTYAVFNAEAYSLAHTVYETELTGSDAGFGRGYDLSKWVAEKVCYEAQSRGIPVTVYRTGFISGDTRTGIHNKMDPISLTLAAVLRTGYTLNLANYLHLTPVDFCSQALVRLSLNPATTHRIFHLVQDHPLTGNQITAWLQEEGYRLELVSFEEWRRHLKEAARQHPEFMPLVYLFSVSESQVFGEGENIATLHFDSTNVRDLLDPIYHCPRLERSLLARYVDYILSVRLRRTRPTDASVAVPA